MAIKWRYNTSTGQWESYDDGQAASGFTSTPLKPGVTGQPVPIAPAAPAQPTFTKVGTPTSTTPTQSPPPAVPTGTTAAQPKPNIVETSQETAGRRAAELPPDQRIGAAWNDAAKLQAEIEAWLRGALSGIPESERAHVAASLALTAYGMYGSRVAAGEDGARVRDEVWAWARERAAGAAAQQGIPLTPPSGGLDTSGAGPNPVGTANIKDAQAVYTESIQKGRQLYEDLLNSQPQPAPTSIPKPINYEQLAASSVGAQQPIVVRDQDAVRVAPTDTGLVRQAGTVNIPVRELDPAQAAAARAADPALQQGVTVEGADTRQLRETSEGRGALADETAALMRLAQNRSMQQRLGLVNQARGSERRGARRALLFAGGQEDLDVADRIVAQTRAKQLEAQTKLLDIDAAQKALQANLDQAKAAGDQKAINDINTRIMELEQQREITNAQLRQQSAEFTEGQRVDVGKFTAAQRLAAESKIADIIQQTNIAQANLNQAKARGDADAANAAEMELARLRLERDKVDAELAQDASKFNISNAIDVQKWDIDTALKAQGQEYEQWLQTGDMRIKATESLQKAAQGLLNEDQRQRLLTHAERQLDLAEQEFKFSVDEAARKRADENRRFWTTFITSLVASGVGIAMGKPPTGAHGGAVTGPRLVEVGEAGDHELIVPIKGKLSERLAAALELEAEPFEPAGPKGQIDTVEDLVQALEASLRTLKVDKAAAAEPDEDEIMQAMAGGVIRGRKRRALGGY